jgi:D-tyrosyl-tRNA(Tyr) deacylase
MRPATGGWHYFRSVTHYFRTATHYIREFVPKVYLESVQKMTTRVLTTPRPDE